MKHSVSCEVMCAHAGNEAGSRGGHSDSEYLDQEMQKKKEKEREGEACLILRAEEFRHFQGFFGVDILYIPMVLREGGQT